MRNVLNGMLLATFMILFLNEHILHFTDWYTYSYYTGLLKHSLLVTLQITWSLSWPVLLRSNAVFVA